MSSQFVNAMDDLQSKVNGLVIGENGMLAHATTNSNLLDLFFSLVRELDPQSLSSKITLIMNIIKKNDDANLLVDLFILMFQTRDCRNGKGEKKLFYYFFLKMYKHYPETVIALLHKIPKYGYFKDFLNLLEMIIPLESNLAYGDLSRLQNAIIDLYAAQLLKDKRELDASKRELDASKRELDASKRELDASKQELDASSKGEDKVAQLSFAAKFAPRHGKQFNSFYKLLVKKLFPKSFTPEKNYRKLVVELTKALEVPEILMCAKRYEEINFKNVPSLCLNRCRKAFLNELVTRKGYHHIPLGPGQEETGNRFPDDPNRVQCRNNLQLASAKGKVCGKVLQPHELVKQLMTNPHISSVECSVYDAQWMKIKEGVLEGIAKFVSQSDSTTINLGKLVPLVDVSGSMDGIPMIVAISLGILVSELSNPAFRNRFITFHENPRWVSLEGITSLRDKVVKTKGAPWGGSTNFEAALTMILKVAVEKKLTPEEIPDLIVFSDMQFNQAGKYGETMHDLIKRRFAEAGYGLPKIIYWNLRANTVGFPVQANAPNTQLLSGFSPSLLKLLLDGEPLITEEVTSDGTVINKGITPEETLRKALDDKNYDSIRSILSASNEGLLSKYSSN
jgi:hypothetical protein